MATIVDDKCVSWTIDEALAAGAIEEMQPGLHWLSFADSSRPKGTHFLGAVIIEAPSFIRAVELTHKLGINPGGEVVGMPCDPAKLEAKVPPSHRNRLLSRADLDGLFGDIETLEEHEARTGRDILGRR